MKKSFLIFAVMLLFVSNIMAQIASGTCGGNLTWRLSAEGELTIEGTGEMTSTSWNSYSEQISTVTIGEGVTNIGDWYFASYPNLTSVTIPASVTIIRSCAFMNCSSLASVAIAENSQMATIGGNAFKNCSNLTLFTLPASVTTIGNDAFWGTGLISFTIPENSQLTTINDWAFNGCAGLTTISFPASLTSIGHYAFNTCKFTSITCNALTPPSAGAAFPSTEASTLVYVPTESIDAYKAADGWSRFTNWIIASGTCGDNLTWRLSAEGELTIEGTGEMYDYASIEVPWYEYRNAIHTITLPEGVTSIGSYAFQYCGSLTNITIPEGVTSIGLCAFENCSRLTSITLPEGVKSLGLGAFSGCRSLTSITLPESVTTIEESAFSNCFSLTSINIPGEVTGIKYSTFAMCSSLISITLPEGVKSIGEDAFQGCNSLTSINIPESVTSIGVRAFAMCYSLAGITIPKGVTCLGESAFSSCESLTSITSHAVTPPVGGADAFGGVDASIPVYVPAGSVDAYKAADGWNQFTNWMIASGTCGDNLTWRLTEEYELIIEGTGAMLDYSNESAAPWQDYKASIKSVDIKEGVTSVGSWAFSRCATLTDVSIAESVTRIGGDAFRECLMLEEIALPEGLTELGTGVFLYCSALKSITVPEGVTKIGSDTFEFCPQLSSITFPSSLTEIGPWALLGARNLSSITCKAITPPSIGVDAFGGANNDIAVYVPSSSVEDYKTADGWSQFTNIQPIVLAAGSCGENLTWKLNDAYELTIEGTESMYDYASSEDVPWYEYHEMINKVVLRVGVMRIGDYAFSGCSNLTSINIPEGVTSIGGGAFYRCSSLASINIPEGVTSIKYDTFARCSSLTSITLPESMTVIEEFAFYECRSLTSITLPEGMTSIGYEAFAWCSHLASITSHAATPPTILDAHVFDGVDNSIPVYVPTESVEAYKVAEYWSEFTNILPLTNEYSLKVSSAGYATLYLDYAAVIPEDVKVYIASNVEGDRLKMAEVKGVLPANTGVIVRATAGTYTFAKSDDTPAAIEGSMLTGTTTNTYITATSGYKYYVLAQQDGVVGMYRPKLTNGQFLNNANKAYLALDMNKLGIYDEETNTDEEGGQLSNGLRFSFGGETGVEQTTVNRQQKTVIYDLQGRMVTDTKGLKGIYIVDGKKTIIK